MNFALIPIRLKNGTGLNQISTAGLKEARALLSKWFGWLTKRNSRGAGKTSLAPFLLRDRYSRFPFVNADAIASGLSAFEPESVAIEAGRVMLGRLNELAEKER